MRCPNQASGQKYTEQTTVTSKGPKTLAEADEQHGTEN